MLKKIFYLLFLFVLIPNTSFAICPVCTIAVGAGLGLSRWLGIDDTISSLWIGGLIVSLIMWTNFWLDKKNINFKYRNYLTSILYYALIILPLYFTRVIGHFLNTLWGIDKIVLGTAFGSIAFFAGSYFHFYLKKKNNHQVHFPFQKIVFAISPLIILSLVFYFITK